MSIPAKYIYISIAFFFLLVCPDVKNALLWGVIPTISLTVFLMLRLTLPDGKVLRPKQLQMTGSKPCRMDKEKLNTMLFPESVRISKEMDEVIYLVVRDFIISWFERIDNNLESEFPDSVRLVLREAITKLYSRLKEQDSVSFIVFKLIPLVTKHFNTFCVARNTVFNDTTVGRLRTYDYELKVAIEFNNIYRLHKALSLKPGKLDKDLNVYIKKTSEELINILVNRSEQQSPFVFTLGREILAQNILLPLIQKFYDPDRWNLILIYISKKILKERNQVHEVRSVLTRELQQSKMNNSKVIEESENPAFDFNLDIDCTGKQFESYLRKLSLVNSVTDLRAAKFLLSVKVLKIQESEDIKDKPNSSYKKRLMLSLNLIETQLRYMTNISNEQNKLKENYSTPPSVDILNDKRILYQFEDIAEKISLDAILNDSYCLTYFQNFLTDASNNIGLEYLKYWKVVNSFKNPLEGTDFDDLLIDTSPTEVSNLNFISDNFLNDETLEYMSTLDDGLVKNILLFTSNDSKVMGKKGFILARKSMLLLQSATEVSLEKEYLTKFKKSSMFLRMISSPKFVQTDIYSKYFNSDIKEKSSLGNSELEDMSKVHLNAVRLFSSPDINEALDKIVNGEDDINGTRHETRKQGSDDKMFNNVDNRIINSSVEGDNSNIFGNEFFTTDTSPQKPKIVKQDLNTVSIVGLNQDASISNNNSDEEEVLYGYSSLKYKIGDLTLEISQIESELELLKHLILKADLTNNKNQLKLLRRSQKTLMRELQNKELTKQQLLMAQNSNSLYKKTHISINSYYLDYDISRIREVVYYLICITHTNDGSASSWEIPRRFNEFEKLHIYLKKQYKREMRPLVKKELFPSKMSMSIKYHLSQGLLYDKRKAIFQIYLAELINIPEICQNDIFRRFLTNPEPFNTKIDKDTVQLPNIQGKLKRTEESNTDSASDITFSSNSESAVLLQEDGANLNLGASISNKTSEIYDFKDKGLISDSCNNNIIINKGIDTDDGILRDGYQRGSLVKPICDLFVSIFSTSDETNYNSSFNRNFWLRGGAIILVLQQLFGSTIEKYIRDNILKARSEARLYDMILQVKISLWGPGGFFETRQKTKLLPPITRSETEKRRTCNDSKLLLQALMIELCGKVVGLRHAKEAGTKVHDILQNPYSNASLLLEILDLIMNDIAAEY